MKCGVLASKQMKVNSQEWESGRAFFFLVMCEN